MAQCVFVKMSKLVYIVLSASTKLVPNCRFPVVCLKCGVHGSNDSPVMAVVFRGRFLVQ